MEFSDFGRRFSAPSGINDLMVDLGMAVSGPGDVIMMGGGNPAHIPAVEAVWRRRWEEILDSPGLLEKLLGDYDPPSGNPAFLETLAEFFRTESGWDVSARNLAVVPSSQAAFFLLFNLLAGGRDGVFRRVLFPLVPEYIGYAGQGIEPSLFTARRPRIELLGADRFKYHVDFDRLDLGGGIAAVALSRPTNPTANVVADGELSRLAGLCRERGIPLLVDNAYGSPFPDVLFCETDFPWQPGMIFTFSLSKLGLPGTRTGIILADEEVIRRISVMNASLVLSNGSIGQAITQPLFASGEIRRLCREVIRPFYRDRRDTALRLLDAHLAGVCDYRVHSCDGAFFLWLWLPGLGVDDTGLYERLKARGVLVIPGSHFFPGLDEPWPHRHECLRLSYCRPDDTLERGVRILADEAARIAGGKSLL